MQIVTFIEQFDDLTNMSVEEVVDRLKIHEERFRGYEDREKEKHLLLTHEKWLAQTKKKDAIDSSFLGTKGHDSHKKESKGHGCGRGRGRGHHDWGGHDNTSQTHDNANHWKGKSLHWCWSRKWPTRWYSIKIRLWRTYSQMKNTKWKLTYVTSQRSEQPRDRRSSKVQGAYVWIYTLKHGN